MVRGRAPVAASEQAASAQYGQLAADVLPPVVQSAMGIYGFVAFLGFALILAAVVGSMLVRKRKSPAC